LCYHQAGLHCIPNGIQTGCKVHDFKQHWLSETVISSILRLRFPLHSVLLFAICVICDSLAVVSTSPPKKRQSSGRSRESVVISSGLYNVGRSVYQYWLSCPSAFHSSWRSHIPSLNSETCCRLRTSPHSLWLSKLYNTSLSRRPR
jgi:hypothetical protein